jgi:hypothetical protein
MQTAALQIKSFVFAIHNTAKRLAKLFLQRAKRSVRY